MMLIKQIIAFIIKYRLSIFPGIWLFEVLIFSNVILKELKELNLVITTIVVLVFSVPVSIFWLEYNTPVLRIKEIKKESSKRFVQFVQNAPIVETIFVRIVVENIGRTAAKKCKGYIIFDKGKERTYWTSYERSHATINVKDGELLDLFSFLKGVEGSLSFPTEKGWDIRTNNEPIKKCKILVTSENAEPVEANVKIDINHGEIVVG